MNVKCLIDSLTPDARSELEAYFAIPKQTMDGYRPAVVMDGYRPAVVTDFHCGVAFAYVPEDYALQIHNTGCMNVRNLRNVFAWDTDEGIGQLAARGPGPKAKIGAVVEEAAILDASKVYFCSANAEMAFLNGRWVK